MFRETEFAAKLSASEEVLRMATVKGADIAGVDYGIVEESRRAKLLVLDGDSDTLAGARDPIRAVVRRAGRADVKRVIL
jgi:cytosine/adenosine deaminase-related metal-dependent hydrolase